MLSDCEGDELKDDQLFSFAAEIHIELVTLVCDTKQLAFLTFEYKVEPELFRGHHRNQVARQVFP